MQFVAFLYLMAFQQPMLDNEFVTVHMATDQPQSKSELHRHALDRVMIYLDDGKLRIENVNGPVENQSWKPGQVAWSPAGGVESGGWRPYQREHRRSGFAHCGS